jgi:hypothetical protein
MNECWNVIQKNFLRYCPEMHLLLIQTGVYFLTVTTLLSSKSTELARIAFRNQYAATRFHVCREFL